MYIGKEVVSITILMCVLFGMFIYAIVLPIVEALVGLVQQGIEVLKGKMLLSLAKMQDQLEETKSKSKSKDDKVSAIGFVIPPEEEICVDDE